MKKNLGFGEALEIYLRSLAQRSPLPRLQKLCFKHCGQAWPIIATILMGIVILGSIKYVNPIVSARDVRDAVNIAAKNGDYTTTQDLYLRCKDSECLALYAQVYPEQKILKRIAELEEKLEIYPENREIYLSLANLYVQIEDREKSQEYLERARILDPNDL